MDHNADMISLPNEKVKDAVIEIFNQKLKSKNYKLEVASGSSKGDNYIGVIHRAKAVCEDIENDAENNNSTTDKNKNSLNELSIIVKVPPENLLRRKQFFARPCFLREALVYDEIIPMFMKFQESKGIVPNKNGFYEVAECFKTLTEDMNEVIILQDLKHDGFEMYNRMDDITIDHVMIVIKTLAKVHALSVAIKDQSPDLIKQFDLVEIFAARKDDQPLLTYFDELVKRSMGSLKPDEDKEIIEKLEKLWKSKSYIELLLETVDGKRSEPYSVITHGDCWNNNILFKNKNGKPVEARLLDWQLTRYSSPVCDLMYYIFGCTTKELRDEHYANIIDQYYIHMAKFIKDLGSDPEKTFPRAALDEQLKKFGNFGLLMALLVLPVFTTRTEDVPDLDDLSEQLDSGNVDVENAFSSSANVHIFNKRMRDVIIDMIDLGYI